MPLTQISIEVVLEGGETWTVIADQRDVAKYELQEFFASNRLNTMTRFLAWAAGSRQGKTELSWPKFNAACIEAGDPEKAAPELDPTQPDPSGDSSKTSQQ